MVSSRMLFANGHRNVVEELLSLANQNVRNTRNMK